MVWGLLLVTILSFTAGVSLALYRWMKRTRDRIVEDLRETHGADLRYVSGCGVVSGYNRVPGVLALLADRILCRPLLFVEGWEILLHCVVAFHSEETRTTRYARARKYLGAHVLAFRTDRGNLSVFVIRKAQVRGWEEALGKAGLRPGTR